MNSSVSEKTIINNIKIENKNSRKKWSLIIIMNTL